ncbi:MAG: DUF6799 domain-containing protein [Bacteroidota bacterium]
MKKILLTAVATLFIAGVYAQSSTSKMDDNKMENKMQDDKMDGKKMEMKDGVMMMDDKAMLCSKNKCTPLTKSYSYSDGCKVSSDGTITKPDGSAMKLTNGSMIDKNGIVTMIPHGQKGHVCSENCPMHSKM